MKKIEKIELVERSVVKYIADDGLEFDTEESCKEYEQAKNERKLIQIEQCEQANGNPMFDGCEHMEYNEYIWYRPKNEEEIAILEAVYGTDCGFSSDDIGKWICVENCDDSAWKSCLEDGIEYVKTILDRLGYTMTVTRKQ